MCSGGVALIIAKHGHVPLRRYFGMLVGPALILGFGLTSKPDTSWVKWARKEARKELKEEGVL